MKTDNNIPIIIKTEDSQTPYHTQKQFLLNKQKDLNNKLYIYTKNFLYTQQKVSKKPKSTSDYNSLRDIIQSTKPLPSIYLGKPVKLHHHKTAFMVHKEKMTKSSYNLTQQKKAKAKEIHDESNLMRMNIMIIHNNKLQSNKIKRMLVNDQMNIMKKSISNYKKLKKMNIESHRQIELEALQEKTLRKQREFRKVINSN